MTKSSLISPVAAAPRSVRGPCSGSAMMSSQAPALACRRRRRSLEGSGLSSPSLSVSDAAFSPTSFFFFFYGFETRRDPQLRPRTLVAPDLRQRDGDFLRLFARSRLLLFLRSKPNPACVGRRSRGSPLICNDHISRVSRCFCRVESFWWWCCATCPAGLFGSGSGSCTKKNGRARIGDGELSTATPGRPR